MVQSLLKFVRSENGATAIEYGLVAALVAIAGIIAFSALGGTITDSFVEIASNFCTTVGGTFSLTESGAGSCSL